MADHQLTVTAEALFAELGYDGCRDLREALRVRMAEHRQAVADERRAAGLSRPRSDRQPTKSELSAAVAGGTSEATVRRMAVVKRWAPHLVPDVLDGTVSVWAAYRQALAIRDSAAVQQARA